MQAEMKNLQRQYMSSFVNLLNVIKFSSIQMKKSSSEEDKLVRLLHTTMDKCIDNVLEASREYVKTLELREQQAEQILCLLKSDEDLDIVFDKITAGLLKVGKITEEDLDNKDLKPTFLNIAYQFNDIIKNEVLEEFDGSTSGEVSSDDD